MTVLTGRRLYIKHGTGTGKTLGALSLAKDFLQVFKTMYDMGERRPGNVIVIGFNIKPIFYRELLRFTEFGLLTSLKLPDIINCVNYQIGVVLRKKRNLKNIDQI